jgi:hypothetical protein
MNYIECENIDLRITQFFHTLESNIRHIKDDVGWHQHLGTHKVGNVATAISLLLYKSSHIDCKEKEDCLNTLIKRRCKDGGWPYITNSQSQSNIESTCWVIRALNSYNDEGRFDTIIKEAVEWIDSLCISNNENGGWPFQPNGKSRIYITCLVLSTLKLCALGDAKKIENALHWLRDCQNNDGGWGEEYGCGSRVFFTAYVIITLIDYNYSPDDTLIRKAIHWLNETISKENLADGAYLCFLENIEIISSNNDRKRVYFFHYVLPYIVLAYNALNVKNQFVFKSIDLLIKRSKDGEIAHPMLENSKLMPIWAISDTCNAFISTRNLVGESWNKKMMVCIFQKYYFWNNYFVLRFLIKYRKIVTSFIFVTFLAWLIIHFTTLHFNTIAVYLKENTLSDWKQIILSFIASVLFAFVQYVFFLIKRVLSPRVPGERGN